MFTKRNSSILTGSFAVILALTACGGGSSNASSDATRTVNVAGVQVSADPTISKMLPEKFAKDGLAFAVSPPYLPFYEGSSPNIVGPDIDMANAIAARLGTTANFGDVAFDGVIPATQSGRFDVILGQMADTKSRQEVMHMITYMGYGIGMVVPAGNPESISSGKDLCGLTLAIPSGWSPADYFDSLTKDCLSRNLPAVTMKRLPKAADTILAVQSGTADASYVSTPTAIANAKAIKGSRGLEIVTPKDMPGGWNVQNHGVAVLKAESELSQAIAAALDSLIQDGTVKKIFQPAGLDQLVLDKARLDDSAPETGLD
ncbi:transporter substrate-binding domain-containing protein [Specibacter sp. RAF43]|uniref:transporter substrate-binding domain-containing protein n=1 Tax=Specibacter sp. RAF43 TaxID=3233057 RepID=UPI003F9529B6